MQRATSDNADPLNPSCTGRNPQTGAEIKISASTVPRFTAGASFKTAVAREKAAAKSTWLGCVTQSAKIEATSAEWPFFLGQLARAGKQKRDVLTRLPSSHGRLTQSDKLKHLECCLHQRARRLVAVRRTH